MSSLGWTPWHKVVSLRDDLKSGELSLAVFAADLYEVAMQTGRRTAKKNATARRRKTYLSNSSLRLRKTISARLF